MRATLIVNPNSGGAGSAARLAPAVATLRAGGWQIDVVSTSGPGDATNQARQAREAGQAVVIVAGGDGTINEAAQALVGTTMPLAPLPFGTANVLARQMGLPLDPVAAARALLTAEPRPIDVGEARWGELGQPSPATRHFLLWAGVGFDAEVARNLNQTFKRWLGVPAVVVASVWTGFWYRGSLADITLQSAASRQSFSRQTGLTVVANAGLYALMQLHHDALMDDGRFDVTVFAGRGRWRRLRQFVSLLFGRHHQAADVEAYQAQSIVIHPRRPMPIQLDGEPVGHTPLQIELRPKALTVLAPRPVSR